MYRGQQTLEADRYLGTIAPERCVCCGQESQVQGDQCNVCKAPWQITHTAKLRGTPTRFVPVLGASGAGKTVYLGMLLDMLNYGCGKLRGLANGAFSMALQEETIAALEARRFPDKTASEADQWRWVHCEVNSTSMPRKYLDIVTPDLAGEAISLEVERPGAYPAIRAVVSQARGLILLCDSLQVRDNGLREDLFAVKLVLYIYHAHVTAELARKRRPVPVPLAIVFTKADGCFEARQDPSAFAAANLSRLIQFLKQGFANYRFFSTSVVGSTAGLLDEQACLRMAPLHIEPRGITEPFEWILDRAI